MKHLPIKYIDVSNWNTRQDVGWKGTRDKDIYEDPEGVVHYFKFSHERYPWEFWSEVIASKLGQQLGLDIVDYNVGFRNPDELLEIGCLSGSMIDLRLGQSLIHGIELLRPFKVDFDEKKGTDHSFQLIRQVFDHYKDYKPFLDKIIELIVFDAIIGNRDRHQENWGIIRSIITVPKQYISVIERLAYLTRGRIKVPKTRVVTTISDEFSPIYDSGSSLAHNVLNEDVSKYLEGDGFEKRFEKYAFGKKAQCHIRWNDEVITFYEMIDKLVLEYPKVVKSAFKSMYSNFNAQATSDMIENIDREFPFKETDFDITGARKEFIRKLIEARMGYLKERLL